MSHGSAGPPLRKAVSSLFFGAPKKKSKQALQVLSPVLREARRVLGAKAAVEEAAEAAK